MGPGQLRIEHDLRVEGRCQRGRRPSSGAPPGGQIEGHEGRVRAAGKRQRLHVGLVTLGAQQREEHATPGGDLALRELEGAAGPRATFRLRIVGATSHQVHDVAEARLRQELVDLALLPVVSRPRRPHHRVPLPVGAQAELGQQHRLPDPGAPVDAHAEARAERHEEIEGLDPGGEGVLRLRRTRGHDRGGRS